MTHEARLRFMFSRRTYRQHSDSCLLLSMMIPNEDKGIVSGACISLAKLRVHRLSYTGLVGMRSSSNCLRQGR